MQKHRFVLIFLGVFLITVIFATLANTSRPFVLSISDVSGQNGGQAIGQQFKIEFSRPMNQASVEKALSITPHVTGNSIWTNNVLYFTPTQVLRYGQIYTVTVNTSAKDLYGLPIQKSYSTAFRIKPLSFMYLGDDQQIYEASIDDPASQQQITSGNIVTNYATKNSILAYVEVLSGETFRITQHDLSSYDTQQVTERSDPLGLGNIQLSSDATTVYYATGKEILAYNLLTKKTQTLTLGSSYDFSAFWLLPDDETFLLSDWNSLYFLHALQSNTTVSLGQFDDFGGADSLEDMLVFMRTSSQLKKPQIYAYNGKLSLISASNESAVYPIISRDGKFISYSYLPDTEGALPNENIALQLKVISVANKKIIINKQLSDTSLDKKSFSPDGHYLAVETYTQKGHFVRTDHNISNYDTNPNEQATIRFIDIDSGGFLPIQIPGKNLQWVE